MKRMFGILLLVIIVIVYLQIGRTPYIHTATTKSEPDGYVLHLTITANKLFLGNKEQFSRSLLRKILENDFKNMQFSYDEFGYPKEIFVTVYINHTSKLLNVSPVKFHYATSDITAFTERTTLP